MSGRLLIQVVFCACLWRGVACQGGDLSREEFLAVVIGASLVGALFIVTIILVIVVCRRAMGRPKTPPPSHATVETVSPKMASLPITQARSTFDIYNQPASRFMHPTYENVAQSTLRLDKTGARSDMTQDVVFTAERPQPTLNDYVNHNGVSANQGEETETSGDWRSVNANDRTRLVQQHSTTTDVTRKQSRPIAEEEDMFAYGALPNNAPSTKVLAADSKHEQPSTTQPVDTSVEQLYSNSKILNRQSARNSSGEGTSSGPAPPRSVSRAPPLPGGSTLSYTGTTSSRQSHGEEEAANAFRFLDDL